MADVLQLDRGQGKTTAILESIDVRLGQHGYGGFGLLICGKNAPAGWEAVKDFFRGCGDPIDHRGVFQFSNGNAIHVMSAERVAAGVQIQGDVRVWIDDADSIENEAVLEALMPLNVILVTATPGPTLAELEASWAMDKTCVKCGAHFRGNTDAQPCPMCDGLARQDERRGMDALLRLGAKGHSIDGIDPEKFGAALRLYGHQGGTDARS